MCRRGARWFVAQQTSHFFERTTGMKKHAKAPHLAKNGDGFVSYPVPPLSDEDKDSLIINFLRSPEFFETAITHLKTEHFDEFEEPVPCLITGAIHDVYEKQKLTPKDQAFPAAVRHEITTFRDSSDEYHEELKLAAKKALLEGGLFRRAVAAKQNKVNPQFARSLLKRFLQERTVFEPLRKLVREFQSGGGTPEHLAAILEETQSRLQAVSALDEKPLLSFGEEWGEHNKRLQQFHGKKMIGLKTGLKELDDRTLGLRGVTIFAAKPGAGKTTYTLQIAVGVCEQVADNDALVVFLSLDMSRFDMFRRVHCNLADMDWKVLMFGSPEVQEPDSSFSNADQDKLKKAEKRFHEKGVSQRMVIVDREFLGDHVTPERLKAMIRAMKKKAGVKRALLVVDYLQLIPVSEDMVEGSDLAADKHRIRVIQQVLEGSQTTENPLGDAALVISEARKPANSKKGGWGGSLSDLMGSARLGYAADAVLLYREMDDSEVCRCYLLGEGGVVKAKRRALLKQGIVPVMLTLEKGRDGMSRGSWPQEFLIWKSKFRSLADKFPLPDDDDDEPTHGQASASEPVELPQMPPGSVLGKAKKSGKKSSKQKAK